MLTEKARWEDKLDLICSRLGAWVGDTDKELQLYKGRGKGRSQGARERGSMEVDPGAEGCGEQRASE